MLKVYGFSRVNPVARGDTTFTNQRVANVRAYRERCLEDPAWKRTVDAYRPRVEAG